VWKHWLSVGKNDKRISEGPDEYCTSTSGKYTAEVIILTLLGNLNRRRPNWHVSVLAVLVGRGGRFRNGMTLNTNNRLGGDVGRFCTDDFALAVKMLIRRLNGKL
jgi:hypothetical protein